MFASLKKKCLGSYQWSTINFLKSKKKKKKKKKRIRLSPLVCYKCSRMYSQMMVVMIVTMMDLFSFNDRVPVQETLANTKPLVEAVIPTLDVTACVPLDLAVELVKKVNFVFATILEDIQWWLFWQGGVKEFFSQMWNVIDTILRLCCTYVTNKRYTK